MSYTDLVTRDPDHRQTKIIKEVLPKIRGAKPSDTWGSDFETNDLEKDLTDLLDIYQTSVFHITNANYFLDTRQLEIETIHDYVRMESNRRIVAEVGDSGLANQCTGVSMSVSLSTSNTCHQL